MLAIRLQILLLAATVSFLIYIIDMVRNKKLELHYIIIWLFSAFALIVITIMPGVLDAIAKFLHVQEPVNALFMSIIFFLIMIIFSLTKILSKNFVRVSSLAQELGILKLEIEKLKNKSQ